MKIIIPFLFFISISLAVYFYSEIFSFLKGAWSKYIKDINQKINNAFIIIKKEEIVKIEILLAVLILVLFVLTMNILIVFIGLILDFILPKLYIEYKHKKYISEYSKNLPGFIESLISSLKAGLSVSNAFKIIAQKDKSPIGKEMEDLLNKISLGKSLKEGLQELADKIKTKENEILISALITGIEAGGNISSILENILKTIRKREEIDRELKALTSQGILSGFIVGLLPFFLIIAIYFIDPEFVQPLFTTQAGIILLCVSVIMEIFGILFIRKMVKIE